MTLLGIKGIHKVKYITFPMRIRTLLGRAKHNYLNHEKEEIGEVKRNAVVMVNLEGTMEGKCEEVN